jgi:hypothetical protein
MSDTSKCSIFRAPLSPASNRFHVGSTPHPSGVNIPNPVTTTRLIIRVLPGACSRVSRHRSAPLAVKRQQQPLHVIQPSPFAKRYVRALRRPKSGAPRNQASKFLMSVDALWAVVTAHAFRSPIALGSSAFCVFFKKLDGITNG